MAWGRYDGYGSGYPEYVSAGARRANAQREARKLAKDGRKLDPVVIEGRKMATSYWGSAWCEQMERHGDYSNRLPRGRSYARNGSVLDLQITEGKVLALVQGSSLYQVKIDIERLAPKRWQALAASCAGKIDSVVELLQGRVPEAVLQALGDPRGGLFPAPKEIDFDCSCPDYADLCKHIAAVLYGVGARLDRSPELFFTLRKVALGDLVSASAAAPLGKAAAGAKKKGSKAGAALDTSALEGIFGIEFDTEGTGAASGKPGKSKPARKTAAPVGRGKRSPGKALRSK